MHRHVVFALLSLVASVAAQEPDLAERVKALEARVAALEQLLRAGTAPAVAPETQKPAAPADPVQLEVDAATKLLDAGEFAAAEKALDALVARLAAKDAPKVGDALLVALHYRRGEATAQGAYSDVRKGGDTIAAMRRIERAATQLEAAAKLADAGSTREGASVRAAALEQAVLANVSLFAATRKEARRKAALAAYEDLRTKHRHATDPAGVNRAERAHAEVQRMLGR